MNDFGLERFAKEWQRLQCLFENEGTPARELEHAGTDNVKTFHNLKNGKPR